MTKSYCGMKSDFIPPPDLAHLFPVEGANLGAHRLKVKLYLLGLGLGATDSHLHEGMISRGEVQGWPKPRRVLIMTPINCVLISADENLGLSGKYPPAREEVYTEKCAFYGKELVDRWLWSLPFKVPPKWIPKKIDD